MHGPASLAVPRDRQKRRSLRDGRGRVGEEACCNVNFKNLKCLAASPRRAPQHRPAIKRGDAVTQTPCEAPGFPCLSPPAGGRRKHINSRR
ncbi:conserved hypothetical protein [Citreicella sp. SE45]|nr:conserved hypothetical protein [Citreicella sp. SE45]